MEFSVGAHSDYTSGGVHNYVRTNDPQEWRSWEHFVNYGTCLILHELSSVPCAQCIVEKVAKLQLLLVSEIAKLEIYKQAS